MIETKILVSDPVADYGKFNIIITECGKFSVKLVGGSHLFSVPQYNWCYLEEAELPKEHSVWLQRIPETIPAPVREHLAECLIRYEQATKKPQESKK